MYNPCLKNFEITKIKRDPYFKMNESHFHNVYEIYYLLSGTRKIFINDSIYNIKKGDLAIFFKGDIHKTNYISHDKHERITLMFSDKFIEPLNKNLSEEKFKHYFNNPILSVPLSKQNIIEEYFAKIDFESNQKNKFYEIMIKNYIQELIIFIIRLKKMTEITELIELNTYDRLIQKAAKYIALNFNNDISLNMVAEFINMSPTYFSKKFKNSTGFGFNEYLIKLRIREATILLIDEELSITEIAFRCGFNNSNYFGDVFKKIIGIPPSEFRKTQKYI